MTISPGVTVAELMKFFLQRDICFESDLLLPTATYGGILSGGCHVSQYAWISVVRDTHRQLPGGWDDGKLGFKLMALK